MEFEHHSKWSQEEVNLRWLDLVIELLDKPDNEINTMNGIIYVTLPFEYVRPAEDGRDIIFHNGVEVGKVDPVFKRDVYGRFMKYQYEFIEDTLYHIRGELYEFRRYYIHLFNCDSLYNKMKKESDENGQEVSE